MQQGPLTANVANSPSNVRVPLNVDGGGNLKTVASQPLYFGQANELLVQTGGLSSALNVTAAAVVKATPGKLAKIIVVIAPTTSGALTVNDAATTGAAATANQVLSIPFGSLTAGQVIDLEWPCGVGIVISAVGGGTPQYSVSFS